MSDDITISGGSIRVAESALRDAQLALVCLGGILDDLADELRPVLALDEPVDAVRLARVATENIRDAAGRSRRLACELLEAAGRYGGAERDADSRMMDLSTLAGWAFGRLIPFASLLAALALPDVLAALGPAFVVGSIASGSPEAFLRRLGALAATKASVLRDPRVVSLIRVAVSGADDAMLGAAGLPLPLTARLDDRGTGAFGLHGGARVVVGAGRLVGLLEETPVEVARTSSSAVAPPSSFADLAQRVPPSQADAPQIRVERYVADTGKPAYIVYVGGTVDMSPKASAEPFDITSDLAGVARLDPAAVRATEQAMSDAGVSAGDTVIPVGYSQGGIVATAIATSGEYDTPALVTFGSPTAGIDVSSDTVDVAVEHTDDLVPALGGIARGGDAGGGDRILVTRQTYTGDVPPHSSPIDAHHMGEYALTAQKMDVSGDPRLAAALATLPGETAGTAEVFRAERLPSATDQQQCVSR